MNPIRIFLLVLVSVSLQAIATPPEPPEGKRWTVNEKFSDEFNGDELDDSKWFDHHPNWKGRPPGLFLPSQVSVVGGYMSIRGEKMDEEVTFEAHNGETRTFNIACGAVVSKTTDASFGYYECRFKAAKTTMSTTFWLSTRRNFDGPKDCDDKYGLELDIQECIGRTGDFDGKYFANGMNSNSHFWYTDCEGKRHDLRAPEAKFKTEALASDAFNTYGAWWHDESSVTYYFNDGESKTVEFNSSIKEKPFDQTMGVNMVSETYPFPWIELPNDAELADPTKNICHYDWVRAYTLVNVNAPSSTRGETIMFDESVAFARASAEVIRRPELEFIVVYMANADRELYLEILDETGRAMATELAPAIGGYGKKRLSVRQRRHSPFETGATYTARLSIRPWGSTRNHAAYDRDEFSFIVINPIQLASSNDFQP